MSNIEQVKQSHYDETQIQVLEGLEAVRKRPGMYIGSTGPRGLHHLVYEIVDNAIDEALAGYCTHIKTEILEGDVIRVTDNGRGIPVGIHPKMGIPAVTVVYTILHAGGKFGGEGYKVSGGLHGVGASVVNALSEWLIVEVKNGEHIYRQKFARGVAEGDLQIIGDTDETGTRVTFKPDGEIFEELVFDYETLHTRLREQAFLNAGVRMTITDRRTPDGPSDSMCYEGGIRSFVEFIHQRRGLEALHEDVIYMKGDSGDNVAEVAMQYNDSYNELLLSFANNINTGEGGTHEEGFKQALTRVLNAYARKNNLLKEKDKNLSGDDCREGLTAIISVKLREPQFEGQTKGKLGNTEMRGVVSAIVTDKLTTYFEENPQVARIIIEKAITASRAAEAARKKAEAKAAAEKVRTQAEAAKSKAQQKLNAVTPGQRMIWPVRGKIKSDFAKNTFGLEIAGTQGDVVVAAMQGEVIWVGTLKGYSGTLAVVKHSPTLITAYGGLENVAVSQGSKIKSGQKIADLKGDTLRFEVRETGKCVDPLKYLNKR